MPPPFVSYPCPHNILLYIIGGDRTFDLSQLRLSINRVCAFYGEEDSLLPTVDSSSVRV